MSTLQWLTQRPQSVHLPASTLTPNSDMRANSPYIAPSGHMKRQKARYTNAHDANIATIITNLRVKSMPSIENLSALAGFASSPIAPSNVPAGQMYLQNAGTGNFCAA